MCNKKNTWFNDYEDCLSDDEIILKSQPRFKSDYHNIYIYIYIYICIYIYIYKRLQIFDKITTYSYGTNAFKTCESEMLSKYK